MKTVLKTYKFKLYESKQNKHLSSAIDIASEVWNYSVAMYRRYHKLYHKTLSRFALQKHITKIKKQKRYEHWNTLNAQAIQDAVERVDRSYKAFFEHVKQRRSGRKSPPHFCKRSNYQSFTLKQCGYKFHDRNRVTVMGREYKYFASRPLEGVIKTVTVKRIKGLGFFLFVVCREERNEIIPRAGKAVGYDFGLKHFLTADDGTLIDSPAWYAASLKELRVAQQKVSRCKKGSNNRKRAIRELERLHFHIAAKRRDWFFKLARQIVSENAVICIEDLNMKAMQKMWGRKISDYAFTEFVGILQWVAFEAGSTVVQVDRWYASSKTCHNCGAVNEELALADREWDCPCCGVHMDRDVNAALNIKLEGLAMSKAA